MKTQDDTYIDVFAEDIQNRNTGRDNKGVRIDIEGKLSIESRQNYHKVRLWLTEKEVKQLIKSIKKEL